MVQIYEKIAIDWNNICKNSALNLKKLYKRFEDCIYFYHCKPEPYKQLPDPFNFTGLLSPDS